jgi:hypothetical protein
MTTSPGGDAMTVRFPRDDDADRLKRETVPWPVCFRVSAADAARFVAPGHHCETRKCREPIAMVTWRWWRSTEAGRVLLSERGMCVQHGRAFAERHGIEIEPAPDESGLR